MRRLYPVCNHSDTRLRQRAWTWLRTNILYPVLNPGIGVNGHHVSRKIRDWNWRWRSEYVGYNILPAPSHKPAAGSNPSPRPLMPRRTSRATPHTPPSKDAARHSDLVLLPLRRQTLTGMTADAIRERILRHHYAEGSPLRQDAIGAELGVSRIPVREALRQLEAEGLVTFNPHRGAVVSTLSLKQIAELYELRADIESDLIRRAVPHMTAEDDSRAAEILDAYESALHAGQVGAWGALNWQFHSTLYAPADREFTMGIVSKLHQQSDRYS